MSYAIVLLLLHGGRMLDAGLRMILRHTLRLLLVQ